MMLQFFEETVSGLEQKLNNDPGEYLARKKLALALARLGVKLYSGEHKAAWCGVLAPFDLLQAMDVTSCFVEFVGAMLASTGAAAPFLERAEQWGMVPDACSYHRAVNGATLAGMMPEPEFLIATSAPCTGGLAVLENLARHFDKKLLVLHVPQERSAAGVRFLADQLRGMVDFVAEQTGRPLDPVRLRQAMENTNKIRELMIETYALAAHVPTPARRRDLVNLGIVIALLLGSDEGVDIARTYRDEFRRKVEQGVAGVPTERVRLMWLQNRIQFKNPIEQLLEEDFGAAVVCDEFNDVAWDAIDPDDPYEGLARRMVTNSLTGPVDNRVAALQRLAAEYKIDGAINPCQWGCRQGTGARGMIEKGLNQVGVPVLNLEVDCVDQRPFAEAQLRTRVEAFIEMLESR